MSLGQSVSIIDNNVKVDDVICYMCGLAFGEGALAKTKNHAIPKMLNPKYNVIMPLHKSCHEKLNSIYFVQTPKKNRTLEIGNSDFEEFSKTYNELRTRFHNKQIGRGEFGEGLWKNLVSHMTNLDNKLTSLKEDVDSMINIDEEKPEVKEEEE